MILFVDESESTDWFLVGGIVLESREVALNAYKRFKHKVKNYPINSSERSKVFTEFKSVLLDKKYQRIKLRMIEELASLDCQAIYACHRKDGGVFTQEEKERVYISLLSRITDSLAIDNDLSIVFDTFNKPVFEVNIINAISKKPKVQAIMPRDSQLEEGLQFADNLCSIFRQFKNTDTKSQYYLILEDKITEILENELTEV